MKALAVLATLGLAVAISASDAHAGDKTARLDDPATTGAVQADLGHRTPKEIRPEKTAITGTQRDNGLSGVEMDGIRAAIRGQLLALSERDATRAFSFLAPATQEFFTDAPAFLRSLMQQLQPLASVTGYAFSDTEREATDAIQSVLLADHRGAEWLARFTMERQPDGSWGIKSCKVEPVQGDRI